MNPFVLTRIVLLWLFCWIPYGSSAQGAAQERAYTQQREAAARAADERAHIQAAYTNNLPNGYGSSGGGTNYGGSSEAVIRDMVEGWQADRRERRRQDSIRYERKWGAYNREVAKRVAAEKAMLEEQARSIQNMNEEIARRTAGYRRQMDEAGFTRGSDETGAFMHDLSAVMPGGVSQRASAFDAMMTYYSRLMISKQAYNNEKGSADPQVLLAYIYEYTPAWQTALADLDELAGRIPQAVSSIDTARMLAICYFFGLQGDDGRPTYNLYSMDESRQTRMAMRFGEISARNPGLAISMLSSFANAKRFILQNPVKHAIKAYAGKESGPERAIFLHLCRTALYIPEPPNNFQTISYRMLKTENMDRFWKSISKEDWKVIFRVQGGSAVSLLESMWLEVPSWAAFAHTDGLLSTYASGDYNNHQKGKWKNTPGKAFEQLMEHNNLLTALEGAREAGDADAINTLAVMTAHDELGDDKSKVIPMLREAASKGSLWARWNLVMACGWELDDYGKEQHPAAVQALKSFCDGATPAQLYELYILMATTKRAVMQQVDFAWLIPDDLTLHVIRAAAAKNVGAAAQRLNQAYPERYPY